jgi:hypothetical protein
VSQQERGSRSTRRRNSCAAGTQTRCLPSKLSLRLKNAANWSPGNVGEPARRPCRNVPAWSDPRGKRSGRQHRRRPLSGHRRSRSHSRITVPARARMRVSNAPGDAPGVRQSRDRPVGASLDERPWRRTCFLAKEGRVSPRLAASRALLGRHNREQGWTPGLRGRRKRRSRRGPETWFVAEAGTEPSLLLFGLVALKGKPRP